MGVLHYNDANFGCILLNDNPFPPTPKTLLHGELICALSFLRGRLDNPDDNGRPEETLHELAPPVC